MVFECKLCEKETCLTTSICEKCRRIKHLINLYGDRVYEVLEEVLIRTDKQQENKIGLEIKKEKEEIENKINTRSQKKN